MKTNVPTMEDLEQQYYEALNKVLTEAKQHNVTYEQSYSLAEFTVPQIRYFEFRLMTNLQMKWLGVYETAGSDKFIDLYQDPNSKELIVVTWGEMVGLAAFLLSSDSALAKSIEELYWKAHDDESY